MRKSELGSNEDRRYLYIDSLGRCGHTPLQSHPRTKGCENLFLNLSKIYLKVKKLRRMVGEVSSSHFRKKEKSRGKKELLQVSIPFVERF